MDDDAMAEPTASNNSSPRWAELVPLHTHRCFLN
jgi:hypothetical protein